MKLGRAEVRKLRSPLILFVALIAAAAAAVLFVLKEKKHAEFTLVAAENQRAQSEKRLRQARGEEQEIKQKSAQFQQMLDRGMVGAEHRLDWVELLREVRDRQKLFEINYEIAPQQKLDAVADGYEFQSSSMRIEMSLLHEEDLLRLLGELQQGAKALVLPHECTLSRLGRTASEPSGPQAQLKADCSLQWITVRSPEKKS